MNYTSFGFNGQFFEQVYGTDMGSPISPILADFVMTDLEDRFSDKEFHEKNLDIIKKKLYDNNLPEKFVLGHIEKRLFYINRKNNNSTEFLRNFTSEIILWVPYIEGLSERLNKICSKHNIKYIFKS